MFPGHFYTATEGLGIVKGAWILTLKWKKRKSLPVDSRMLNDKVILIKLNWAAQSGGNFFEPIAHFEKWHLRDMEKVNSMIWLKMGRVSQT